MAQTRQELRMKWTKENTTRYNVNFHNKYDADLIDYVETEKKSGKRTTDIFREGIRKLIK